MLDHLKMGPVDAHASREHNGNMPWNPASTLADLEAEGYDHLSVYCERCRGVTTVWFSLIASRRREGEGISEIAALLRVRDATPSEGCAARAAG